jgi:adenylate kinase family enzyme
VTEVFRPQRIVIVGSSSGAGKTTLGRALAADLGVTFIEYDALQHGPGWTLRSDHELAAHLGPIVEGERWVIDALPRYLGEPFFRRIELVIWLDMPPWVWLPRLVRRSGRRLLLREQLWNGNRETIGGVIWEKDSVFRHAIRRYFRRRTDYADRMTALLFEREIPIVRVCQVAELDALRARLVAGARP